MFANKCTAVHPETGRFIPGEFSGMMFGTALPPYLSHIMAASFILYLTQWKVDAVNRTVLAIFSVHTASLLAWFLLYRRCRPWIGFFSNIVITVAGMILVGLMLKDMLNEAVETASTSLAGKLPGLPASQ